MYLSPSNEGLRACERPAPAAPLRIALAGYGVVGQALAARLAEEPGFEIAAILVRDLARARAVAPPCPVTADRRAFGGCRADILIDALSCARTGAALSANALEDGLHVVSASKRAISERLRALAGAARQSGARLLYAASVGGGAPILETVAAASGHGRIVAVDAVLNGTVNLILDRLHRGLGFDAALAEARQAGFAEADPQNDLSGADAAAKLRLIAAGAFDLDPGEIDVTTEPLDEAAAARIAASGERWLQRASLRHGTEGIRAHVALIPASQAAPLTALPDEWNCAVVTNEDGRTFRCKGRGAGGAATAEAIAGDLFRLQEVASR